MPGEEVGNSPNVSSQVGADPVCPASGPEGGPGARGCTLLPTAKPVRPAPRLCPVTHGGAQRKGEGAEDPFLKGWGGLFILAIPGEKRTPSGCLRAPYWGWRLPMSGAAGGWRDRVLEVTLSQHKQGQGQRREAVGSKRGASPGEAAMFPSSQNSRGQGGWGKPGGAGGVSGRKHQEAHGKWRKAGSGVVADVHTYLTSSNRLFISPMRRWFSCSNCKATDTIARKSFSGLKGAAARGACQQGPHRSLVPDATWAQGRSARGQRLSGQRPAPRKPQLCLPARRREPLSGPSGRRGGGEAALPTAPTDPRSQDGSQHFLWELAQSRQTGSWRN